MKLHNIAAFACLAAYSVVFCNFAAADDDFADLKTIRVLPITEQQVKFAFDRSLADACEQLPASQPLEMRSFTQFLTDRDRRAGKGAKLPSTRQSVLSVGLEIAPSDRATLPKLSGGKIREYLETNCVLVQVRLRKDTLDRKLYFHHRPLAATAQFRGSRISQSFQPIVSGAIRDFHSIGLFVEEGKPIKAEELRTLVLVFRNNVLTSTTSTRTSEEYEYGFVRGREGRLPDRLEYHLFVTTDGRQNLHYMTPFIHPTRPAQCSILGSVAITDYDSTGLYPKESATRSFRLSKRATFTPEQISAFCEKESLEGGIHSNLTKVLDAAIDGKLAAER